MIAELKSLVILKEDQCKTFHMTVMFLNGGTEAATRDVLLKTVFLKNSQIHREKPVSESLFNEFADLQLY